MAQGPNYPHRPWSPSCCGALGRARRAGNDRPIRARRGPRGRLRRAVALVGRGPRGLLGRDLGVLRRAGLRAVRARARAPRDARRASGSRGRGCPTPSTSSAAATTTPWPSTTPARCASCRSGRGASCARRPPGSPPGCGPRGGPGRPRRRLHAQHPRDDRGLPGDRLDRRGVVERGPRVRRAVGDRPLRADRAEGAAGGRRLPLRRARPRSQRGRRRASPSEIGAEVVRFGYLDGSGWPAELVGRRRAAEPSSSSRSSIRCGCSSARARRACPSRSSTARAGSCSST